MRSLCGALVLLLLVPSPATPRHPVCQFTPLGASDDVIEVAPDGWFEAGSLIGDYRARVDEPQRWTVKAVRLIGPR